jgi:hypothetical protein
MKSPIKNRFNSMKEHYEMCKVSKETMKACLMLLNFRNLEKNCEKDFGTSEDRQKFMELNKSLMK